MQKFQTRFLEEADKFISKLESNTAIRQNTNLIKVSIFNEFSQVVLQADNLKSGKLDVSNLLPGVYIVCISSDSGKYYAKLIKQ